MVFAETTLFSDIPCPLLGSCVLIRCVFGHEGQVQEKPAATSTELQSAHMAKEPSEHQNALEPPAKRRKINTEPAQSRPLAKADQLRDTTARAKAVAKETTIDTTSTTNTAVSRQPSSLSRAISPPARQTLPSADKDDSIDKQGSKEQAVTPETLLKRFNGDKTESLNPRIVTPAPDSHGKRVTYLQHIHSHMARLNRELKSYHGHVDGTSPEKLKDFVLDQQAVIKLALHEEEKIAQSGPTVYGNLIRNCIAMYQRMNRDDWLRKVKSTIFVGLDVPKKRVTAPKSEAAAAAFLQLDQKEMTSYFNRLKITNLDKLAEHGYIFEPPSEAQTEQVRRDIERAGRQETCDRCGSRYQSLADRDVTTGLFTNNGPCRYHWGRKVSASRQKTDAYTGSHEPTWSCCGQELGTVGCETYEEHVFRFSSPARLASVVPFIKTPPNKSRRKGPNGDEVLGVVFDCEMGYTTEGFELIRLTALQWPNKEVLLDVLVRPVGTVIDFNTRFSGVKAADFVNAKSYDRSNPSEDLQVVSGTAVARSLLCEYLDGDNIPLMGHAIDNDLNTTRLCHSFVIDTVMLFPHHRGLPYRPALKTLAQKHLGRNIQTGGSKGHDSFEDAAATLDLILFKGAEVSSSLERPLSSL